MKKLFLILIPFLFFSCSQSVPNEGGTFKHEDYSSLIKDNRYEISSDIPASLVFNLFYDKYGYGTFDIQGNATHTEKTVLMGEQIQRTVTCQIKKVNIYCINNSTEGMHLSSFYVDFYNENNEILSYCYSWQYDYTNSRNTKSSTWQQETEWYKASADKCSWNLSINY